METDVNYCCEDSTPTDLREERGMSETKEMLKEGKHEQKGERTSLRYEASHHSPSFIFLLYNNVFPI